MRQPTFNDLFQAKIIADLYQNNWLLGMNVDEWLYAGIKASICDDLDLSIRLYDKLRKQTMEHIEDHGKIPKCLL
jgi:hypothetical protein